VFVYKATNLANGKAYIGVTRGCWKARWARHLTDAADGRPYALHLAIRKHGAGSFLVEALYEASSLAELAACERGVIAEYGTLAPRGYNLTSGGDGCFAVSPTTRARMRAAFRARMERPGEYAKLLAGVRRGHLKLAGRKRASDAIERTRRANIGQRRSAEQKARIRGGMHKSIKLNEIDAAEIRRMAALGENQTDIAKALGISQSLVSRINTGKRWMPLVQGGLTP
jgi:group I intron endonuclease